MTDAAENRGEHVQRLGTAFPLAAFEQRIRDDPGVLGMVYTGSLGRGDGDRCSDLDISLWVHDEALATPGLLEHYLSWLGEVQFTSATQHNHGLSSNAFVGPDWQRAELYLMDSHHPEPHPYWSRARVVKDTDDRLGSLVAASGPSVVTLTRDGARTLIAEAIYHTGFVTMQNMRGSHYHAMANLCELAGSLYGLLANARGYASHDVRNAERFLHADELALLYAAWPSAPEREAIRHAARGLWAWIQYVWAACETRLGEELGIALDRTGFMDTIKRAYT